MMTAFGRIPLRRRGAAPSLSGATGWLNSPSLSSEDLVGHVVLYVFWTYTCINWLRILPYVRAWAEKYRDSVVVVGVHTPEFAFERDLDNVARAVRAQRVDFPVALDSEYEIWRAFDNHYWPALYLADQHGVLRYMHFGEGKYPHTERAIQQLLRTADVEFDDTLVEPESRGVEAQADWDELESPETYLGYSRSEGGSVVLSDEWAVKSDRIVADGSNARMTVPFHARDLNLVMKPVNPGVVVTFRVTLDGNNPGTAHGLDIEASGGGVLAEPRMYQLIRQRAGVTDRTAEIEFTGSGAEAYVITFG
jgi:thiol-disulfide isomerase/thioredoxin